MLHKNEFRVKTSIGELIIREVLDAEYPGVDVVLKKNESEVNVVLVEVPSQCDDPFVDKLVTRVWGDCNQEDYTKLIVYNTDFDEE